MKQIIRKKHIGRPVDFLVTDRTKAHEVVNGRIENVRRGIATIRYWLHWSYVEEGYVTYVDVNDSRICAIY